MQQVCSNCRYPLQPGNAVCTNCGTPVSASGGGSYDPTIRAGSPPGAGYSQPSYGAPSMPDPYGAQYSGPSGGNYGTPPGGSFGAPPSSPYGPPPGGNFGAPPPQPGYGAQPPYGTPVGYPGQFPQQQKSHKGLYLGLGIGGVVLAGLIIGCIVLVNVVINKGKQVVNAAQTAIATITVVPGTDGGVTTGPHITKIAVGTGQDPNTFEVTGATDTFPNNSTVYVSFTVVTQDTGAQIVLKLYAGSTLQDSTNPVTPDPGTTTYGNSADVHNAGEHTFEVDYNGAKEATITFNVTG